MLIDEGKCIDYRGIIITRLNRGRTDITSNSRKMRNPSFPRRDDWYAVTTSLMRFRLKRQINRIDKVCANGDS
jgi:hypothetical protein